MLWQTLEIVQMSPISMSIGGQLLTTEKLNLEDYKIFLEEWGNMSLM
jgi:hypothetical protein